MTALRDVVRNQQRRMAQIDKFAALPPALPMPLSRRCCSSGFHGICADVIRLRMMPVFFDNQAVLRCLS